MDKKTRFFGLSATATFIGMTMIGYGEEPKLQQPKSKTIYVSAAQLAAGVSGTLNGAGYEIPSAAGSKILMIKRDETGGVEVHMLVNDIFVVETGHAVATVGGEVKGNHEVRPAEWRGGEQSGGTKYNLSPGDLLFIPAGVAHQLTISPGSVFTYLTIKTPTASDTHQLSEKEPCMSLFGRHCLGIISASDSVPSICRAPPRPG